MREYAPAAPRLAARADRIHPAGQLTHRDLISILPMLDGTVMIEVGCQPEKEDGSTWFRVLPGTMGG
jgi:hypothetical protein